MPRIYIPGSTEGYELLHTVADDGFEAFIALARGVTSAAAWRSPAMQLVREDEAGKMLFRSDSPWYAQYSLVFRPRARAVLEPLVAGAGEFLPLACEHDEGLSVLNVTQIIDALDESASEVLRFRSGRLMDVRRYVFREEKLRDAHIFKIPNLSPSPTLIGDVIVSAWREASLKGLEFYPIWPSPAPGR